MNSIGTTNTDEKTLLEALKGDYGTIDMANGIRVTKAGRVVHFWGAFPKGTTAFEVPKMTERYPLLFSTESGSMSKLIEPNRNIVDVPFGLRTSKFIVLATILLNQ